jgi:uncharacterized protein (DUF1501 family)
MKRRNFIQTTGLSLPVLLNGFSVRAFSKSSMFSLVGADNDKVLVLINLVGGNDGLAMITPLDQYDKLANARGNILVPQGSLLEAGFDNAFHPAMTGLKSIYDDAKMTVVQAVGYPNQNRSHFRSTDIWTSASPADQVWTTGWMGRYFQQDHPAYPEGYPGADFPHPFAITIGSSASVTCQGTAANFSLAITDPFNLNPLLSAGADTPPNTPYGEELTFLRQSIEQTNAYGDTITAAANAATNLATYTDDNRLAQQLKNVALMIAGGLQTKVYVVSLGGFDTHAAQVADTPVTGDHATLLQQLSDAVASFQQDMTLLGLGERVLTMTFSEFGRRIRSNGSLGTDHGDAAPLLLFGHCVNPGFIGNSPEIPTNPDVQEAVAMQYDFRNIYGSIFMDWFGVEENAVRDLLFGDFAHIPIIGGCSASHAHESPIAGVEMDVSPNPFAQGATVRFVSGNEQVRLSVFNGKGQEIEVLVNKRLPAGQHELSFNGSRLRPGTYYFHLRLEGGRQKVKMLVKA